MSQLIIININNINNNILYLYFIIILIILIIFAIKLVSKSSSLIQALKSMFRVFVVKEFYIHKVLNACLSLKISKYIFSVLSIDCYQKALFPRKISFHFKDLLCSFFVFIIVPFISKIHIVNSEESDLKTSLFNM